MCVHNLINNLSRRVYFIVLFIKILYYFYLIVWLFTLLLRILDIIFPFVLYLTWIKGCKNKRYQFSLYFYGSKIDIYPDIYPVPFYPNSTLTKLDRFSWFPKRKPPVRVWRMTRNTTFLSLSLSKRFRPQPMVTAKGNLSRRTN